MAKHNLKYRTTTDAFKMHHVANQPPTSIYNSNCTDGFRAKLIFYLGDQL